MKEHKKKLRTMYNDSNTNLRFVDFLIERDEAEKKKMIIMAGDLGEAFSKICDLEYIIEKYHKGEL